MGIFSPRSVDILLQSEHRSGRARTVVLLAFENRFASLGGLAPVMKYLPQQLDKMGERVMFF